MTSRSEYEKWAILVHFKVVYFHSAVETHKSYKIPVRTVGNPARNQTKLGYLPNTTLELFSSTNPLGGVGNIYRNVTASRTALGLNRALYPQVLGVKPIRECS
jgi:hypothetical protein